MLSDQNTNSVLLILIIILLAIMFCSLMIIDERASKLSKKDLITFILFSPICYFGLIFFSPIVSFFMMKKWYEKYLNEKIV